MPENCLPSRDELPFWLEGKPRRIEPPGKASTAQNWILLTYGRLAQAGHPVVLCHTMPERGVVVALTGNLPAGFRPSRQTFLVGVVADGIPHPACHFHVLQNAVHARRLPRSCYLPHWPQPGLVSRDPGRGDRFENLVFFGDPPNLAPELRDPEFAARVWTKFGIRFRAAATGCWHDYAEADAALAIRSFGPERFLRKPSTKLINAWLAGVPFLGGGDSAFSADGSPGANYLRCSDGAEVEVALKRLRDDLPFRLRIVSEGRLAAEAYSPEKLLERWTEFLNGIANRTAPVHCSSPVAGKAIRRLSQRLFLAIDRLRGG